MSDMKMPDILQESLGLVIRLHRERNAMTQEDFAHDIGLHRTYYGLVERGQQNLTLWNLQRIALGLDVPASQLLKEAEELDVARARQAAPNFPRRGRPRGKVRAFKK
jgi:transcriptional regulator with XRE-family HTH domain